MIWLPFVLAGIALVGGAIVYSVYSLSKKTIKQIAAADARTNEFSLKIKNRYQNGDFNVVNVGLRDRYGNEMRSITIQSDIDENDYHQGQVLDLFN